MGAIHEARDWEKVQTALFITRPDDRVQGRGKTGQQNQSTECAELLTQGLLSLSGGWSGVLSLSLAGLQGLGSGHRQGGLAVLRSGAGLREARRPSWAGPLVWGAGRHSFRRVQFRVFGPVPGFQSSSGFSVSGGTRLKGSTAGSWSV